MFVLDSHCDTPSQIIRGRDLAKDNPMAHVDFPKLKRGGVDGAFFALYISAELTGDAALEYYERLLRGVLETLNVNSEHAVLTTSEQQALINKEHGLFSVFLGLENGSPIGKSLDRLTDFHNHGIRYVTLCHSADNEICDSCASTVKTWNGLSPFGREVVREMNRLGMLIDVSHISDDSFYDVLKYSSRPVVATHSCCRTLADHPRNMTDDMIRALAAEGGVVQINFYPVFLDAGFGKLLSGSEVMKRGEDVEAAFISDPFNDEYRSEWFKVLRELQELARPSYKVIVDHIDHVVDLVGIDHVGLGSDFDGIAVTPEGLDDISMIPLLFDEMRHRGYSETDIEKIASKNFFRVFSASGAVRSL